MRRPRLLAAVLAVALVPSLSGVPAAASPAMPDRDPARRSTDGALFGPQRPGTDGAPTSRLARTDRELLIREDATPVAVLVKLDHDPVATYAGGVVGLAPTSPAVTGRTFVGSAAEGRYEQHLAEREQRFVDALSRAVPAAEVGQRLRTVYGGVSATVPANRVDDVLRLDGVVAVQRDEAFRPATDASAGLIGAGTLDPGRGGASDAGRGGASDAGRGGASDAGRGVIVGVLDSGVWPEHPSFADRGTLGAPPGPPRACDFGDNPLTPEPDQFRCNHKLIGGRAFLDTYNSRHDDETYPASARDSDGHGTHTASTAAGNVLASARLFGVERGPLRGVAPGAWLSVYKVCGRRACYQSDSVKAVEQAVRDGVDVVNFSVPGGADPFTDPVELAFLDAYAAGVFVATSAGNAGPGAGTVEHASPWVTTTAATSSTRGFTTTLRLRAGGRTLTLSGTSVTAGPTAQAPVVLGSAAPYGSARCETPAPAGAFTGKIVVCERGGASRTVQGYNVVQGGAVGMILYNPGRQDVGPDNHWLPTVHLADGRRLVAWLAAHPGAAAAFGAGKTRGTRRDTLGRFSSRGPRGPGIKPDLAAPGVQVLAAHTPVPDSAEGGPPGEQFRAMDGTSTAAPLVAGAAALLRARHPRWTPGQVKSALMTTARSGVLREDGRTRAGPFDRGSGRVDPARADRPGLTFDETAGRMRALSGDGRTAVHLNLPSVDAPLVPGRLTTVRTARNVTGRPQTYRVRTTAPAGSRITVTPGRFTLAPGRSVALTVTITSTAPAGQRFGEIRLEPQRNGLPTLRLPVAFVHQQGGVTLRRRCASADVVRRGVTTCTVTATDVGLPGGRRHTRP